MSLLADLMARLGLRRPPPPPLPEEPKGQTEAGRRTPRDPAISLYRRQQVDFELGAVIREIRYADRVDTRVKKIHGRTSRAAVKGGVRLFTASSHTRLIRLWKGFEARLSLNRREKLESDARGLMMEGNLPVQWVLDDVGSERPQVVAAVRMPTETIVPLVGDDGRFLDPARAYEQRDLSTGGLLATFPLWQLNVVRLTPDSYDDQACFGRPYLDASRKVWRQLIMTEEDLVVRRRTRAPLRMVHTLEGASEPELEEYRRGVESDQAEGNWRDYYMNRKGSVAAVQGDAALDQIADVEHLLDSFFAGAPAPKGLFGYTGDLARDVLDDLKKDYFDELDSMQDCLAYAYDLGFRLHLLLQGLDPHAFDFRVGFAERHTETASQRADRALKLQALGLPMEMVWEAAGYDPTAVWDQLEAEEERMSPYPAAGAAPRVAITPGNDRKGDSATTITTRG